MFLCLLFYLLAFNSTRVIVANCCDRTRSGFVEFSSLVTYLHDPQVVDHFFTYNNVTDDYFINRNATIEFNENHYFLDDFYEPFENRTKVCLFKLFKRHEEIEHLIFNDGSRPKQIVFGCQSDQECCEVGCCTINKYIYFWFIYPCVGVLVILAYTARRRRIREVARIIRELRARNQ